jgi:putative ABC transport system ATP-binding protein
MRDSPAISPPMVELEDIHLTLGSRAGAVNILRGIDLILPRAERLGVVGPSGSGKSTMMMVIAGLERATRGSVRVNGIDLSALDEDGLALFRRAQVGIVFQSFHLIPTMTALENVAIPLELAGAADASARAQAALEAAGLGHRLQHYPGQLSGGEQQRVAIARAFAPRPALLLADEPTGNLDRATGAAIIELLFSLSDKQGATLLLITHDLELVGRCDRIARLADGKIVAVERAGAGKAAP